MRATAAPEEGNRVRLSVEIEESEVDHALDEMLRRLSREVRVPGFRPGKVPRRVIEARMGGAAALRGEALREALPDFYARAVVDTEVDPIDRPEIDITSGDDAGPVRFDALVQVRPSVAVPGYQGLVVTIPSIEVPEEDVVAQIDRLRATAGELVEVDRPAADGDQVTIDIYGKPAAAGDDGSAGEDGAAAEGGETATGSTVPGSTATEAAAVESTGAAADDDGDLSAEDYLYEVGSGGLVPELDDALRGARAGDELEFTSQLEGLDRSMSFRVQVKGVKELVLPDVTDDWAAEASEFGTVAELKADIGARLRRLRVAQANLALRQRAVDALVELVDEEIPPVMVEEELAERVHDLSHRLESQGIGLGQFLAATGRDESEIIDELRAGALHGVKADLALRAVAEAEAIEVTDDEVDEELEAMASRLELDVARVRSDLERTGRLPAVRSDRRKAKALDWLVSHVEVVDEEGRPVSRDDLDVELAEEESQ